MRAICKLVAICVIFVLAMAVSLPVGRAARWVALFIGWDDAAAFVWGVFAGVFVVFGAVCLIATLCATPWGDDPPPK